MAVASTSASSSTPHDDAHTPDDDDAFLDSVEGEIAFFRSIMRARPVGIHRHFHLLVVRNAIYKDTARLVSIDSLWRKLRTYYNLDALEVADSEHENLYVPHKNAPPIPIPSPSPTENLAAHPFFRNEFQLPGDAEIDQLIAERRMRSTPSPPSTPRSPSPPTPAVPPPTKRQKVSKKRGKSQSKLAGLIGGDSDSSALTQESGDEAPETPRDSVITDADIGTEDGEEEDVEMAEPSASAPVHRSTASPRPARGRGKGARGKKAGTRGSASTRASAKKRKR